SGSHPPGAIVGIGADFDALPSMTAAFDAAGDRSQNRVPVHLEGELTAVGTLDVAGVESDHTGGQSKPPAPLRPPFDLRPKPTSAAPPSGRAAGRVSGRPSVRPDDGRFGPALAAVQRVFGKGRADVDPREARHLVRELEKTLGERAQWTTDLSRAL